MIVCNLLVIAAFVYRVLRKGNVDTDDVIPESRIEFTTVDPVHAELSQETSQGKSVSAPSAATKSSTWSFPGSKISRSVATVASRIGVERVEE